jgi:RNA polymerase sigma-70 factor (ECF subfamily)
MSTSMTVQPAQASDPERWLDAHGDVLFRYALTRLRRREDAEDAVQDTLLAALQARQDFRGDSAEQTWLVGILRHKIVDRIRLAARNEGAANVSDAAMDDWCSDTGTWLHAPRSWNGDPARLSEDAEFWVQVRRCFAALPERQAQVFALRNLDGLDGEAICKQIGITPTNLWVLLHRARTKLRACLEASWFAPESTP